MVVLYPASWGQSVDAIVPPAGAAACPSPPMTVMAQLPLRPLARPSFAVVVLLLIAVDVFGHIGKGLSAG